MSRRSRNSIRALVTAAALLSLWLLSSEPWGLGFYQLVVFAAPGALLGLGAGWAAHATSQSEWTWTSARRAATFGAATLPPVLAFIVALNGSARPQRLLVGFVYAAWIALSGGAAVALLHQRKRTRHLRSRKRKNERLHTVRPIGGLGRLDDIDRAV